MYNLTAIYWIKDEARYLPEYIEFHLLQGFDHFIFYDNKSTDKTREILSSYINEGIVELREYPVEVDNSGISKNYWVMSHCIDEQKNKSKWIHFHAIDEFIFTKTDEKLPDFLKNYEEYGGLAINWKLFNSNNHIKRQKGLTFENFDEAIKFDVNMHVKTIIQPLKTRSPAPNTHWFYTPTVDENFHQVIGPFNTLTPGTSPNSYPNMNEIQPHYTFNKIQLNHYVTRSREEFDISNSKGLLDHGRSSETVNRERESLWDVLHGLEKNPSTKEYWPMKNFIGLEKLDEIKIYVEPVRKCILKRFENNIELLNHINH